MIVNRGLRSILSILGVFGLLCGLTSLVPVRALASQPTSADPSHKVAETLTHDDGEMDLGLTYLQSDSPPGVFLSEFELDPGTTVTGVWACWTRDVSFSGSSSLDFEAVVYRYDAASNGPGNLLASASGRASAVPTSSDGGRQGSNCRYYRVPIRIEAQGRVLVGVRFNPGAYPGVGGAAGYLLGVDADASLTDGWYLYGGRWNPLHTDSFFRNLGYRAFMVRLDVEQGGATAPPPAPPSNIPFIQSSAVPDFRFKVRIGGEVAGARETSCIAETLCVSGALPGRSELFLRLIGPRPNGYLWLNLIRFTPSEIEVWAEQRSTRATSYYRLPGLPPSNNDLQGLVDRTAFRPGARAATRERYRDRSTELETAAATTDRATFVPPEFPDYRFTVRIFSGGVELPSRRERSCLPETVCISGSIPGRAEAFLRIIGPRPNGFFHVNLVRFTPSRLDVTIEKLSTGETRTYRLPELTPTSSTLTGRLDRSAFTATGSGLPRDPGPENDRTLEGIDSDRDGLRDDVQRFIQLRYGNDPDSVSALRQGAGALLRGLEDSSRSAPVVDDAEAMMRALECTMVVRPSDGREAFLTLVSEVIDTEARLREWNDYSETLDGQVLKVTPSDSWVGSCGFTPTSPRLLQLLARLDRKAGACGDTDTVVYFINGVFNFHDAAAASASELSSRLVDPASPPDAPQVEVELIHNHSFFMLDLFEAVRQRQQLAVSRFYRIMAGLELMPDFMVDLYLEAARLADLAGVAMDSELISHIQTYKRQISEGKKVVVVAHSQGNLFANQAWPFLTGEEQGSFGIVAVASPDSTVADGRGRWVTHRQDLVVRVSLGSLPGNVGGATGDFFGHEFVATYLRSGSEAERRIRDLVRQTIDSLANPAGQVNDGVFTITLTWGSEPDVDLHVFEPGGSHVYYADRQGNNGFLDRDDVTAFGPEHYYASCSTLRAGTYRVGVNYYRGFSTEIARIEIDAGLLNRKFSRVLTTSRGSSGDNSPIPVARIIVTGDEQRGFSFQVIEE